MVIKNFTLLLLLFLIKSNCFAQNTFVDEFTFKGSSAYYPNHVFKTADENFLVTVLSKDSGVFILKLNKNGRVLWQKKYSLRVNDYLAETVTSDNGIVIFMANYIGVPSIAAFKCDSDGNIVWQKKVTPYSAFFTKSPVQAVEDKNKNVVLLYQLGDYQSSDENQLGIIKFDKSGNITGHTRIKNLYYKSNTQHFYVDGFTVSEGGYLIATEDECSFCDNGQHGSMMFVNAVGNPVYDIGFNLKNNSWYDELTVGSLSANNGKFAGIFNYVNAAENSHDPSKGYYYFVASFGKNDTAVRGMLIPDNIFALHKYIRETKSLKGFDFGFLNDKTITTINNNEVRKYDSLERICPDYKDSLFSYDTSSRIMELYIGATSTKRAVDSLTIETIDIKISDAKILKEKCSGKAPIISQAQEKKSNFIYSNTNKTASIFPNPAKNSLTAIFNSGKNEMFEISIMGIDGVVLQSSKTFFSIGANNKNLNIASLPAGVYLLEAISASNKYVLKFAKE